MAIITEDQLDEAPVKGSSTISPAQLDPISPAPAGSPVGETAEQITRRKYPELFKEQAPNVARERQTILGEIGGGLSDFGRDISTAFNPEEKDMGGMERFLHAMRSGLGLARASAPVLSLGTSPMITNAMSKAGEGASDLMSKMGFQTAADVTGALTSATGDVLSGFATAKAAKLASPSITKALPTVAQKKTAMKATADVDIDNAALLGEREVASTNAMRDAQRKELRVQAKAKGDEIASVDANTARAKLEAQRNAGAEVDKARLQAEVAEAGVPDPVHLREHLAKGAAKRGDEVGTDFKASYDRERSVVKKSFNDEYDEIQKGGDVEVAASNYGLALDKTLKEKGISRPLPTKAEGVAVKAKAALTDVDEVTEETVDGLLTQMKGTRDPAARKVIQDTIDETLTNSELGPNPTLNDLISERQRLKAAERTAFHAKDDNLGRQYQTLRSGLDEDIRSANPDTLRNLEIAGERYKNEYVPFFSKRSVTRGIAEGAIETVLDQIVKPTATRQGTVLANKAVERAERSMQLLDAPGKEKLAATFIKRGIDGAFDAEGNFSNGSLVKWWDRYADKANTDSKVLRTVLGAKYKDMEGAVAAFRSSRPKKLADIAADIATQSERALPKTLSGIEALAANKKAGLQDYLNEAPKLNQKAIEAAGKETEAILKSTYDKQQVIKKKLEDDLKVMAGNSEAAQGSFQGAGSIMVLNGIYQGNLYKIGMGGLLILSKGALGKLLHSVKGASVFRTLAQKAPGTAPAAAAARIAATILREQDEEN